MTSSLALSGDLGRIGLMLAIGVAGVGLVLLVFELVRSRVRGAWIVGVTGALATAALLGAVLRPARVETDGIKVGPRVVVLVDRSRSMELPAEAGDKTRTDVALEVVEKLRARGGDVRLATLGFGTGRAVPLDDELQPVDRDRSALRPVTRSDLFAGVESIA